MPTAAPRPATGVVQPSRKPSEPKLDELEIVDDEDDVHDLAAADVVSEKQPGMSRGSLFPENEPSSLDRPRKKKKKIVAQSWFSTAGGEIVGGTLMMVGAVVWFVGALVLADRIFFYPPILFVAGMVAVFRGITGHD